MDKKFTDDTFLARWLNGQLTDEELAEFESQEDFAVYQKIVEVSADLQVPKRNKEEGWQSLSQLTPAGPQKKSPAKIRQLGSWWMYAAAASVLLVLGYFILFQEDTTQTFVTPIAMQETFSLPDGSEVRLNSASSLSFNKETFLENRLLDLDGEAFFSVEKGSQFTVQTTNGDVRVLGTSFNVSARKNKLNVVCFTGKVGVSFDKFEVMEALNPGDQLIAQDKRIVLQNKTDVVKKQPAWMEGESRFEQADFTDVIDELERQYNISIRYPEDLSAIKGYTGGFPHQDLETALQIVFPSVGYQYTLKDNKVVVFR